MIMRAKTFDLPDLCSDFEVGTSLLKKRFSVLYVAASSNGELTSIGVNRAVL